MTESSTSSEINARVVRALDAATKRIEELESRQFAPIAVVSMGCRFPGGADDPESFWRLLADGRDAVGEFPEGRFDLDRVFDFDPDAAGCTNVRHGGWLTGVDLFDAEFFGVSPREARSLDPQQRLLLEVAWEALERAGRTKEALDGSRTGVFVGISNNDYARHIARADAYRAIDGYYVTGNTLNAAAGRISYWLGLRGPSLAVDTACSSSLVAVHLACQALRSGDCDEALAGGVNLVLSPEGLIALSKSQVLSRDGRCRTFDAAADGMGRGEGCGVLVLKRLADAARDGDEVLAVLRGSAVAQDGASSGLTVPNGPAQEAVIRRALENARLASADIDYVEAHGTGTPLGDPIEMRALGAVFGTGRDPSRPLAVGAVKAFIAHGESSAGVAGLVKVILSMRHEEIPAQIHFDEPSPHIPWSELAVRVPGAPIPWRRGERTRRAGVSGFGFSGTIAHVVVEEAAVDRMRDKQPPANMRPLLLAAATPAALRAQAARYGDLMRNADVAESAAICRGAATRRSRFAHRMSIAASDVDSLRARIAEAARGRESPGVSAGRVSGASRRRIAFLYSGQGSQAEGMGQALYERESAYRAALDRCDAILEPLIGGSIIDVIRGSVRPNAPLHYSIRIYEYCNISPETGGAAATGGILPGRSLLDETGLTQPALFALEVALTELWRSWGITPHAVMGHSVGEYAAAWAAGVFSLEDACRLIAARGRLMQGLPRGGAMMAIAAPEDEVAGAIRDFSGQVALAAVNGPASVVISGEQEAVISVTAGFAGRGIRCKPLAVSHAFHSPLMTPMLEEFRAVAEGVRYEAPRLPIISNVSGRAAGEVEAIRDIATPGYWVDHIMKPVRFASGVAALHELKTQAFLEIGPHPVLLALARECPAPSRQAPTSLSAAGRLPLPAPSCQAPTSLSAAGRLPLPAPSGDGIAWIPSLRRDRPADETMLEAAGALWCAGVEFDGDAFFGARSSSPAELPTYPFQRSRHWIDAPTVVFGEVVEKAKRNSIYEAVWREKSRSRERVARDAGNARTWLVFEDGEGMGLRAAEKLRGAGHTVFSVTRGDEFSEVAVERFQARSDSAEDLDALLARIPSTAITGALYFWSLDGCDESSTLLKLQQLLSNNQVPARIWVVAPPEGAPHGFDDASLIATRAALRGLGATIALEDPARWGGMIELDQSDPAALEALIEEVTDPVEEDRLRFAGEKRYVQRLVPAESPRGATRLAVRPDATYLITGGFGGLGLATARRFIERGASEVVLVGRGGASPEVASALAQLRSLGATIHERRADIASRSDVAALLASLDDLPPLRGVIHAAGVLDDVTLAGMTDEAWARVVPPKIQGALNLISATSNRELDFFVSFSSIAATLGSPGQSHYAAANAALDGLARALDRPDRRVVSVNWGPWAEVGMATRLDAPHRERFLRMGLRPMTPAAALDALERVMASGRSVALIVDADWVQVAAGCGRPLALLVELVGTERAGLSREIATSCRSRDRMPSVARGPAPTNVWDATSAGLSVARGGPAETNAGSVSGAAVLAETIRSARTSDARASLCEEYLLEASRIVLGRAEPPDRDRTLSDFGLDSMMATELKNRVLRDLGVDIPIAGFLDGSDVAALVRRLDAALESDRPSESGGSHALEMEEIRI